MEKLKGLLLVFSSNTNNSGPSQSQESNDDIKVIDDLVDLIHNIGDAELLEYSNEDSTGTFSSLLCNVRRELYPARLQRLYMSSKIAAYMRLHTEKHIEVEGTLNHLVDSLAWKSFDAHYPSFVVDPRNVRLGLATDGFNPFGNMSTSYSMWPVVLTPYNMPLYKVIWVQKKFFYAALRQGAANNFLLKKFLKILRLLNCHLILNTPSPNLQQSQSRSEGSDVDTTINEGNDESPIQGSASTAGLL
ncbi:hypothetical protein KSP39_PZI007967 [Platanthera zijinensis]|uniref:Uncharacterized protein n=1 Tax=Platanthera zijinensis TaxID=2320716 RepID=A0AAP0G952_9ASPA